MLKIDPIENWLNAVAFSHSNSQHTRRLYKNNFQKFLTYTGTTAENILQEYNTLTTEKEFKQKYTPIIMSLIGEMKKQNFSQSTQNNMIAAIKSFFKYNSLPLGFTPSGRQFVEFHNRDIRKEEIEEIIKIAQPREKAYYTLMVQSGLRPQTVSKLKIEHLEGLLDENTPIPCLINIPQNITKGQYAEYFTFTAQESINYIKEYFKRQRNQTPTLESNVFTMQDGETPVQPDVINHTFKRTIEKLKEQTVLDFKKTEKDMPNEKRQSVSRNELRLYSLRKYFRKQAGHAGFDYVNFWMGHSAKLGSDQHYFSHDIELHRNLYATKAMPYLTIETQTFDELKPLLTDLQNKLTEQQKQHQKEIEKRDNENQELRERLTKIENIIIPKQHEEPAKLLKQAQADIKFVETYYKNRKKWETEHPEEFTQQQKQANEEYNKFLEEHPEMEEAEKALSQKHLETELEEARATTRKLQDIIKGRKHK